MSDRRAISSDGKTVYFQITLEAAELVEEWRRQAPRPQEMRLLDQGRTTRGVGSLAGRRQQVDDLAASWDYPRDGNFEAMSLPERLDSLATYLLSADAAIQPQGLVLKSGVLVNYRMVRRYQREASHPGESIQRLAERNPRAWMLWHRITS